MNFDAVIIRNQQPLIVRMLRELSDNIVHSLTKARCFVTTAGRSCFRTKRQDDHPEAMFRSHRHASLIRRIRAEARDALFLSAEPSSQSDQMKAATNCGIAVAPFPVRLFTVTRGGLGQSVDGRQMRSGVPEKNVAVKQKARGNLALFGENNTAPFHVRLARELTEAGRALLSDPVGFVTAIVGERVVSRERRKRRRAGASVAGLVYVLALSTMYAVYTIAQRHHSNDKTEKQTRVILLAPLPRVELTAMQPIKTQGGGGSSKNQLTALKQPVSEPSSPRLEFRPLDQISANPKPEANVVGAETTPQPVGGSTAAGSGTGTGGGVGSGEGSGVGSGRGPGAVSNENVDYSGVFSVGSVAIRPQITARPAAAYTDQARRAQVEGSVKLSVVLKADGTVSDIRVMRGLGYGLDEKAIEAARRLSFVPAQKDGRPVSVRLSLEFRFSLL